MKKKKMKNGLQFCECMHIIWDAEMKYGVKGNRDYEIEKMKIKSK